MNKIITTISFIAISLLGFSQTPVESYSFTNGSFNGDNGATANSSSAGISSIADKDNNMNSAINLNGSQEIVYNGLSLNPYNGLSVSFWIKPSASMTANKGYAVFSQRTQCKAVHSIESFVNGQNKTIGFTLRRTNGAVSVNTTYTPDVWQHLTFTFNQTDGKMRVYKNGEYVATGSNSVGAGSIPQSISGNFEIGGNPCVGADGTLRYAGGIDELKIYDERLSELDVKLLWDPTTDVQAYNDSIAINSLVEEYNFDGFAQNYGDDYKYINDADNNTHSALQLDGSNSKTATAPTSTTNGYTISFWVKPDVFSGTKSKILFSQRSQCGAVNCIEVYQTATDISLVARTSGGATSVRIPYTAGQWDKFTFIADRTNNLLKAYKNGAFEKQESAGSRIASSLSTSTIRIGTGICVGNDGTPQYKGGIDELYLYQKNLTDQEITDAYNQKDDDQHGPVFSDHFNASDVVSEVLRVDPTTSNNDTAITLSGGSGIELDGNTIATDGDGYTFSFWIKPNSNTTENDQVVFTKKSTCNWEDQFGVNIDGTTEEVSIELKTADAKQANLSLTYTPDIWQLITYVVDLNELYLYGYVDGVKEDSVAISGHEVPGSYSNSIKTELSDSPCSHSKYIGGFDDLKIYTAPLQESSVSNLYDASNNIITNIWETIEAENLMIYPNPTSDFITIKANDILSVKVLNTNGIKMIETVDSEINISALENGLYLIQVETLEGIKTQKLIKE